jgi:hypothetical protein
VRRAVGQGDPPRTYAASFHERNPQNWHNLESGRHFVAPGRWVFELNSIRRWKICSRLHRWTAFLGLLDVLGNDLVWASGEPKDGTEDADATAKETIN